MNVYLLPVKFAIIVFLIIISIITIPFLLWQHRRYGHISYFHIFILYSLLLYVISAYCLVILPLPNTSDICKISQLGLQRYSLILFTFVIDFLRETNVVWNSPMTYMLIFKERGFLQVVLNVIFLLPLGMYLRYYFYRSFKQTLLIIISVSLFFEITQLTGLYGLYNPPYRLFDIDDLILNTIGGVVGFFLRLSISRNERRNKGELLPQ